jgi:hypothetical protein
VLPAPAALAGALSFRTNSTDFTFSFSILHFTKSVQSSTSFSDFTYDARVMVSGDGDGGVMFRASKLSMGADEYNGYYAGLSANGKNVVLGKANGGWTSLKTASVNIVANTWYQLRIVTKGTSIKIYVDDMVTPKITYTDASFSSGAIGVRCYNAITRWDNLSVTSSTTVVKDLKSNKNISVYPNPAQNHLDITFNNSTNKNYNISILNLNGSLIKSQIRTGDMALVRFDTQTMARGTYILSINSDKESYQTKFIKE